MKSELLKAIQAKYDALDKEDATGHLYWTEFKELVHNFKPKGKTLEDRKTDFYQELTEYTTKYPTKLLREFYDYWSEHKKQGKKMRFEMEKTWDTSRRLARWSRNNKGEDSTTPFKANVKRYNR
jgi:hypothetical protein